MQKFPALVILQTTLQKVTLLNRLNRVEFTFADSFLNTELADGYTSKRERKRKGKNFPFILAEATAKPTCMKYVTKLSSLARVCCWQPRYFLRKADDYLRLAPTIFHFHPDLLYFRLRVLFVFSLGEEGNTLSSRYRCLASALSKTHQGIPRCCVNVSSNVSLCERIARRSSRSRCPSFCPCPLILSTTCH
jgi:hypothetical protein